MKLAVPPRPKLIIAAVLLATNVLTGVVTALVVRARDFSDINVNSLLNLGAIDANFDSALERKIPGDIPEDEAAIYRSHEGNARFDVHYRKYNERRGGAENLPLTLFCWAVAADKYRRDNVDIPVDPAVWRAFLADGPKGLPWYWSLRNTLTQAGAGQGLIRGEYHGVFGKPVPKPMVYQMGPLPRPFEPLPGEETPS